MRICPGDRIYLNDIYCSGRWDVPSVNAYRMPNWYDPVSCLGWYTVLEIRSLRSPIMHKTVPVIFCTGKAHDMICVVGKKRMQNMDRLPRTIVNALDVLRRNCNFQTVTEDELKKADEQLRYIFS